MVHGKSWINSDHKTGGKFNRLHHLQCQAETLQACNASRALLATQTLAPRPVIQNPLQPPYIPGYRQNP